MRGITTPTVTTGFSLGVGMFIDGVDQGLPYAFNQELVDLERVEVLKGPQSTLFGKNTIAGAFSITTKKPGDEFAGDVEVTTGNFGTINFKGTVDMPIVEGLVSSKLSLYSKNSDGFVHNVATGNDVMDQEQNGGRFQMRFTPNDNFVADLSLDYMTENRTFAYHEIIADTEGGIDYTSQIPAGRYTISHDFDDSESRDLWGMQANVSYEFDSGFTLTSISGYRYGAANVVEDTDHTDRDDQTYFSDKNFDQFSQEFRLTSPTSEESGKKYDYILGLFASNQDANQILGYRFGVDSGLTPETMRTPSNLKSTQLSLFGQGNYYLTDTVVLNAGMRINKESKKMGFSEEGFQNEVGLPATDYFVDSLDETKLSPSVGIDYHITEDRLLYGKVVVGYKSGAFDLGIFKGASGDFSFSPEKVTSYEMGFKGSFYDRRLYLGVAAFYQDYESLQIEIQLPPVAPGLPPQRNKGIAAAEISGLEVELIAMPVDGLTVEAGFSQTKAEFTDETPVYGGNDLSNSPDFTGYANATYEFEVGDGTAYVRAEVTDRSEWFSFITNLPNEQPGGFTLYNASAGYETESWAVSLWGKNLADEEYCTERWDIIGGLRCGIARPRTYGLDIKYKF
jgi:iron complex outermembrane receptor protein